MADRHHFKDQNNQKLYSQFMFEVLTQNRERQRILEYRVELSKAVPTEDGWEWTGQMLLRYVDIAQSSDDMV